MKWRKLIEYRGSVEIDGVMFNVTAVKEDDDDGFAVEVNGAYVADCDDLPTREFIEQIIREDEDIAERTGGRGYNLA